MPNGRVIAIDMKTGTNEVRISRVLVSTKVVVRSADIVNVVGNIAAIASRVSDGLCVGTDPA